MDIITTCTERKSPKQSAGPLPTTIGRHHHRTSILPPQYLLISAMVRHTPLHQGTSNACLQMETMSFGIKNGGCAVLPMPSPKFELLDGSNLGKWNASHRCSFYHVPLCYHKILVCSAAYIITLESITLHGIEIGRESHGWRVNG